MSKPNAANSKKPDSPTPSSPVSIDADPPPGSHWLDHLPVIDLGFKSTEEIVQLIREEREAERPWEKYVFGPSKRVKKKANRKKSSRVAAKRSVAKMRKGAA